MVASESLVLLKNVGAFVQAYQHILDVGFLVFARLLGFSLSAPVFGRKDLPFVFRINFAIAFSILITSIGMNSLPHGGIIDSTEHMGLYIVQIFINLGVGLLVGFIGQMILEGITSAGALANNQMGLSAAMTFDPSSRQQVSILDKLFGFIALMLFFHINGMHWMLAAINKTFTIIPLWQSKPNFAELISGPMIIHLSGQTLDAALLMIAPIFIVTIGLDLILGIVNRTAQQIQVFQLSYALKPAVGLAIFWMTLPNFLDLARQYLEQSFKVF